jgi:hypothetical protein
MRVVPVVIIEPPGALPEDCDGIRQKIYANIVALEGSTKPGLGDAVGLRAWGPA